ncbi:MAG: TRAP transporter large permease [Spirochaetaceae bacterium]|jgi:tripartite ATP-independent transporter DctM subunit|nr:TRAP transporter large permease [Spirochaetaceae bacterium]
MSSIGFASYVPLILLIVLFVLRVPIAFSLFISSIYYFAFVNTAMPVHLALQNVVNSLQSFTLLAVPFFIMVGVVMNYSGISKRLMNFSDLLVGHMHGGLGQVNVVLSTLMGGISGSANADAAMDCKFLVPEMEKRGYDKGFCAAVTATSSIIPSIIPPGIVLIVYCMVARVSVGRLFLAGYIPGFLLCAGQMITVAIISKKRGYGRTREKRASLLEILKGSGTAALALFMPLGFLMGIRFGVFTPTEGGALAVLYCFVVGAFVYRELKGKDVIPILRETFSSTAEVLFIVVAANLFGYYLTWERIPDALSTVILQFTTNKYVFLLAVNVLLFIMGMFMEAAPVIIILLPLLSPPCQALGINMVHFGIMMVVNLQIGGVTPPFGSMMFIVCQMLNLPMDKFVKANIPFLCSVLIVLLIITYVPGLVLLLPNLFMP